MPTTYLEIPSDQEVYIPAKSVTDYPIGYYAVDKDELSGEYMLEHDLITEVEILSGDNSWLSSTLENIYTKPKTVYISTSTSKSSGVYTTSYNSAKIKLKNTNSTYSVYNLVINSDI